jgi:hypothetical protein
MREQLAEAVMTIGFSEPRAREDYPGNGNDRVASLPEGSSPRTLGLYCKQLSANLVEVGQCEHGLRSG